VKPLGEIEGVTEAATVAEVRKTGEVEPTTRKT